MASTPRLRPMMLSDLLDSSFRLYRSHFLLFTGIVALLQIPMLVLRALIEYVLLGSATAELLDFSANPPLLAPGQSIWDALPLGAFALSTGASLGLSLFQGLVVLNLIAGALAFAISRTYLGQPTSILGAYGFGLRRFVSLIVASAIISLIGIALVVVLIGLPVGAILFLAAAGSPGVFTALLLLVMMLGGTVLFAIASLYMYSRFLVNIQSIVLEGNGPLTALRHSWQLVSGHFWRTLGLVVLMGIISYLVSVLPGSLISLVLQFTSGLAAEPSELVRNQAITTIITQLGLIIALPLQLTAYTLLYYDLRMRKEGYDLEMMAQRTAPV